MDTDDEAPGIQAAREAPFALYGLASEFPRGRRVVSWTYERGAVSGLSLGHGDSDDRSQGWVEVGVLSRLVRKMPPSATGSAHIARMEIKTLVFGFLVAADIPEGAGSAGVGPLYEDISTWPWSLIELSVEGRPVEFEHLRRGAHWGAVAVEPAMLPSNHGMFICATHIEPDAVQLARVRNLELYRANTARARQRDRTALQHEVLLGASRDIPPQGP